jgi:transcriptional regulator with XRE-family HTH domain
MITDSERALNREIGARLRAARQARRLSLTELAALTGGLYSRSRISNYEQGIRRLSNEGAEEMAAALGNVTAAHLLCLDKDGEQMLSADEQQLVDAFRRTDDDGRRRVLGIAGCVGPRETGRD